jgi:hypothetical protein
MIVALNNLSAMALSTGVCWMVRGTAPLSADVRPSLLSFASGVSARPFFRRSLRSSPHHLNKICVTEHRWDKKQSTVQDIYYS